MIYFNADFGIDIGNYMLEISLWLRNWGLTRGNLHDGVIRHFSFGPLHFSITDRKKLNELAMKEYSTQFTLEDLVNEQGEG